MTKAKLGSIADEKPIRMTLNAEGCWTALCLGRCQAFRCRHRRLNLRIDIGKDGRQVELTLGPGIDVGLEAPAAGATDSDRNAGVDRVGRQNVFLLDVGGGNRSFTAAFGLSPLVSISQCQ